MLVLWRMASVLWDSSQAELKAGVSGSEARELEEKFFRQHPHFKGCDPKLFGVTNLTNRCARFR